MQIKKVIETPQGTATFEGELEADELDLVIKCGLNYLLQAGALPVVTSLDNISPVSEEQQ